MARGSGRTRSRTSRRPHTHRHTHPHRGHAGAGQLPFPGGASDLGDCPGGGADLGCGCNQPGPSGCDNQCGSTLEFDECGVCGGDGILDCDGNCFPYYYDDYLGDGWCDDGSGSWDTPINFACDKFDCDGGDCLDANGVCGGGGMRRGGRVRRQMGGGAPKPWNSR